MTISIDQLEVLSEIDFQNIHKIPFNVKLQESQDSQSSDLSDLQGIVEEKIWEAIQEQRYGDLPLLYDELLNLRIQEIVEQNEHLPITSLEEFKIGIENEITQMKSYYLILNGQMDKAIELSTSLLIKMHASEAFGLLFNDRDLLQIRAAAYLLSGNRELGLKDLIASDKKSQLSDLGSIFLKNSRFEELLNNLFLKVLEKKLDATIVEMKVVSVEEFDSMTNWEKADYYLMNEQPSEALKWVGEDVERKAIALAQLGQIDEALELLEDFQPNTAALIYFMQGDLEAAKEMAEDLDNFSMQSLIFYLQSISTF